MGNTWKSELELLEQALQQVKDADIPKYPNLGEAVSINPTLQLLALTWSNLCTLLKTPNSQTVPGQELEFVVLYKFPNDGEIFYFPASKTNLLALKVVSENLDRKLVAKEAGVAVGKVDAAIEEASKQGMLTCPPSAIQRPDTHLPAVGAKDWHSHLNSNYFTLQWHVTQACDLHCKHCYDRSEISPLTLEQGITILDQFRDFVLEKNVRGQVTFTGGNPLLYKNFTELYEEAAKRNFSIAILGNPTNKDVIQSLQAIQPLSFYQVSLEGLEKHNDSIRGPGHFKRIMAFLEILDELSIYSMVMLTLTRENMDKVLPLGELLRGKTDLFTFNRLSQTGEGAALETAVKEEYKVFLEQYLEAVKTNPTMGLKDNLINIVKTEQGDNVFGGCTGYGCGAAFNFCSILPNGDMHACRKFQSPIGNVLESSLLKLYNSEAAETYRLGPEECRGCKIRPVCGGCQAVIQSSGLDITLNKDPYCFLAP
jgi:selenobiotic family peptide radical SAM maturase